MPWRANHPRLPRSMIYACLALALLILGFELRAFLPRAATPSDDFAAYWAVGRLAAQGRNPYSPEAILALEQAAGRPSGSPLMVWYPPWALALFMPMGLLPYAAGRLLWLLVSLGLFVACAAWLWRLYDGPAGRGLVPLALLGACAPALFGLIEGQVSVLILLGLTGFLHFQRRGRWLAAGACLPLIALKPQLPCLFWLALLLWSIDRRRWTLLLGGLGVTLLAALPALLLNSAVFSQYLYTLTHYPPDGSNTATLGALLQAALGRPLAALQFAALGPGAAWLAWHWAGQRRAWDWTAEMPLVLLAALIAAPFAWMHDQALLLVTTIAVAAGLARGEHRARRGLLASAWALYLAANGLALATLPHWHFAQGWYSLWPLAGLGAYLALASLAARCRAGPGQAALAPVAP